MSHLLAQRLSQVKPSATLAVSAKANALRAAGQPIINLSAGEPDFDTPEFIQTAAIEAMQAGKTRYTPADGIPQLKEAIINKFKRDHQFEVQTNQVLVTSGAKQALYNLTQALLGPGDEALILAPYWVSYPAMVYLAEATPVIIDSSIEQDYKINADQLQAAITSKTKLLFINSPSNPSGKVYSQQELQQLAEVLLQHPQVMIVSDDIYEHIVWNNANTAHLLSICPELKDRIIIVNGVSKAQCMTGWRIGYAMGPQLIIQAMKKIQSQSTSCANSIAQHAATAALNAPLSDYFPPMLAAYHKRHDWLYEALQTIEGIRVTPADGTFYLLPDFSAVIHQLQLADDIALSEYLLERAHVATVPGTAFGSPNCIRFSYATELEQLQQAINQIQNTLTEFANT